MNAKKIYLEDNNITEVPSNAFIKSDLEDLWLESPFTKIGNNAFSLLNNLSQLRIGLSHIKFFPENAFEFYESSNKSLLLQFFRNTFINSSSFSENLFTKLKRPTKIQFTSIRDHRNFSYLDQKAFLPFLRINNENNIDNGEYLNCSDCRNHWVKTCTDLIKRVIVTDYPAKCKWFIECPNQTVSNQDQFKNNSSELFERKNYFINCLIITFWYFNYN